MTIIRLANDSTVPFIGWLRTNIDVLPQHRVESLADTNLCVGRQTGLDTYHADVYCALQPGERQVLEFDSACFDPLPPPPECDRFLGGVPITIAGVPMTRVSAVANGAAYDVHYRARVGALINVDLHVHWYPDEPAWCPAELIICASNPSVPDILQFIPQDLVLRFGDARVLVPGLFLHDTLMAAGDWLADGQARLLSLVLCFPRHGGNPEMCRAIADQLVTCNGIANLHGIEGNPHLPEGFDARAWAKDMLPGVIEAQHHWRNSPLDPATVSGMAGQQGSQSFIAGPAMASASAVGCFYIAALDASWPMHHLEANGDQLDWRAHPGLRMFYGKVNVPISADKLGKTAWPTPADSHSHIGPEDEHWFAWTEFAGARLSGTKGTQWILRAHAIHFLFRYVVEPPGNWLTANRGIGLASFLVAELYRGLADRELAEAVAQRWRDVFMHLIYPMGADGSWWSWIPWPRNASIGGVQGGPARAIPWQACVLSLGLDWAGRALNDSGMRDFAKNIAAEILWWIYFKGEDGRWHCRDVIAQDGSDVGPYHDAYFYFGTPMVVATVLRHDPNHPVARSIWAQMLADRPGYQQLSWLCPSVEVR